MRTCHASAAAAVLLTLWHCDCARADPPYDGWRGTRSPQPAYAGGAQQPAYAGGSYDTRPFDGSRREPVYQSYPRSLPGRPDIWSGLYIGGHVGGLWNSASFSGPVALSFSGSSFSAGSHVGFNVQMNQIVAGLEIDADYTNAGDSTAIGQLASLNARTNWLSSARARLGYAYNNWLFYGTGGLALSGNSLGYQALGQTGKADQMLVGYAVGAGVEVKLSPDFSARLEALHYGFGADYAAPPVGTLKLDTDATTVRVGLSYHFN